jgi:hypothetical protein
MHVRENQLLYFATDLTDFLACRHLCTLERQSAHGLLKRPFTDDPMLEVLCKGVAMAPCQGVNLIGGA